MPFRNPLELHDFYKKGLDFASKESVCVFAASGEF